MRILDENGVEITNPDLDRGHLVQESVFVQHHEAVEARQEVGHYRTIAEYPNGGKDVEWVVDVPAVEATEAWDEYEEIWRYILYTEEELAAKEAEAESRKGQEPITWDDLDAAYQAGYHEGYTEGVNSAYDQ